MYRVMFAAVKKVIRLIWRVSYVIMLLLIGIIFLSSWDYREMEYVTLANEKRADISPWLSVTPTISNTREWPVGKISGTSPFRVTLGFDLPSEFDAGDVGQISKIKLITSDGKEIDALKPFQAQKTKVFISSFSNKPTISFKHYGINLELGNYMCETEIVLNKNEGGQTIVNTEFKIIVWRDKGFTNAIWQALMGI